MLLILNYSIGRNDTVYREHYRTTNPHDLAPEGYEPELNQKKASFIRFFDSDQRKKYRADNLNATWNSISEERRKARELMQNKNPEEVGKFSVVVL